MRERSRSRWRLRTMVFMIFMVVFFGITAYFTYYSNVVRERKLPTVKTVMPEYQAEPVSGKSQYKVPKSAILRDSRNQPYLLVVRYENDILGERFSTVALHVWLRGEAEDGSILVEGIVWEEPIVAEPGAELTGGMEVRIE